jgi:hypothetical protein
MLRHLNEIECRRAQIEGLITLFNADDTEALLARYADEVSFSVPMLRGQHDRNGMWGTGKAALRDYVLLYRERHGRLILLDLFVCGSTVSVLVEDETGNRTEFCLEVGACGRVNRLFAFHVGQVHGP